MLDYFSIQKSKVGESASFRLERPVPERTIHDVIQIGTNSEGAIMALDRLIEALPAEEVAPIKLSKAILLTYLGRSAQAKRILVSLTEDPLQPSDAKWEKWFAIAAVVVDPTIFSSKKMLADVYLKHAAMRLGE
jgi:hypothetical protein